MADHPLRPATDHRHGRPLPHRLANRPQVPRAPTPKDLSSHPLPGMRAHPELPRVSAGYPRAHGSFPTCSSPVRHVSHPKVTPFDLHALGTPPALILSQDQTLHQVRVLFVTPAPGRHRFAGQGLLSRIVTGSPPTSSAAPAPHPKARRRTSQPAGGLLRLLHTNRSPSACHLSRCWVPHMEPPRLSRGDHSHDPPVRSGPRSWLFPVPPWQ